MSNVDDVFESALVQRYGVDRYSVGRVKLEDGLDWVRSIFRHGVDGTSWLLLSTGGIHGSDGRLIEAARTFVPGYPPDCPTVVETDHDTREWVKGMRTITFLVVQPARAALYYGNLRVESAADIEWLSMTVRLSIASMIESQDGNVQLPGSKR